MIKKKFPKSLVIVALAVCVALVLFATCFFFQNAASGSEEEELEKVQSIALMIDPNEVAQLNADDSDLDNPTYRELLNQLINVVDVNNDITYLYILKEKDNAIYFSVDSGSIDGETWPGKVYSDISPKLQKAFDTGEAQFHGLEDGDNSDQWGNWVNAYAPILGDDGEVLGVICMDIDRNTYLTSIIVEASPPVLIILIFIIIIFFYWLSMKHRMEQFDKEKQLLSVASHEVRSPMVSIKWVLENMLETDKDLTEKDRATILAVYNNTAKIISNIEGILSSTPSWSKKKHRLDNVYMKPLLLDIAGTLSLVAKQRRAKIVLDDTITDNLVVKGDRQNLHHAFYNVVNNALKYTYLDTDVIISYARTEKYHQFRVCDRGPGVKPEDRERIFEGLYRTPEALTSKQPGTGLGLYFVKKIVTNHGGKIYVDPEYTEGTCFIVELPI